MKAAVFLSYIPKEHQQERALYKSLHLNEAAEMIKSESESKSLFSYHYRWLRYEDCHYRVHVQSFFFLSQQ